MRSPPPSATSGTDTPRRQSCDRCHGQKLRCTRPDDRKSGSCIRCLRKGAKCVYSSSLPKGRPSLYRISEPAASSQEPTSSPCSLNADEDKELASSSPEPSATAVPPGQPLGLGVLGFESASDNCTLPEDWAPWWQDAVHVGAQTGHGLEDSNTMDSTTTASALTSVSTLNIDPALEAQWFSTMDFSSPSILKSTGSGDSDDDCKIRCPDPLVDPSCMWLDKETNLATVSSMEDTPGTSGSAGDCTRLGYTIDQTAFAASILHLSRLSTQLSQLLGPSRFSLAEALGPSSRSTQPQPSEDASPAQLGQVQLGVETMFKSINTWLVGGSAVPGRDDSLSTGSSSACPPPPDPFDLLHHTFSASAHLLEVLRRFNVTGMVGTSTARCSAPAAAAADAQPQRSAARMCTPPGACTGTCCDASHHSYAIVHHLVQACATLLLNMYVGILTALQRSADALQARSPAPAGRRQQTQTQHAAAEAVCAGPGRRCGVQDLDLPLGGRGPVPVILSAADRVHLQLISVVQMCSYFIRRQDMTLGVLVANSSRPRLGDQAGSAEAVAELKAEVEQRLRRLQESLDIVL